LHTSSPDVDKSTPVRPRSLGVGDGSGTDYDGKFPSFREEVSSVRIIVTCRDDGSNTVVEELGNGREGSGGESGVRGQ